MFCKTMLRRSILNRRVIVVIAIWLGILSCRILVADERPSSRPLIVFSAMGDVPYTPEEYVALPQQISDLPEESEFVVHLGDIKSGKAPCDEVIYQRVAEILAKSKIPLFIIPGDNEWNDCVSPDAGWKLWAKYFHRFDQKWKHKFLVSRQEKRDENFTFVQSKVLFIGINIVGGRVHDAAEWKQRHADDLLWTQKNLERYGPSVQSTVIFGHALPINVHDDYFDGLCEAAKKFEKPVLYLHGDGHRWIYDRPFKSKNILRIQVDQGSIAPPIKVTIIDDAKEPFIVDRRIDKE